MLIEKEKKLPMDYLHRLNFIQGCTSSKHYGIDDLKESFYDYFLHNVIDETEEYQVLEFKISEIHQNEIRGAKNYLLLNKSEKDYSIEYKIYSKNSDGKNFGRIEINN